MSSIISAFANSTDTLNPVNTTIDDFLHDVQNGRWQDRVLALRNEKDEARQVKLKKLLPNVTIGGKFSTREDKSLLEHSGYLAVDIDKTGAETDRLKTLLSADPYFYALFVSCRGEGLCGIVKIEPDKHKLSYKQIGEYLIKTYGVEVKTDSQCSNISRARYVSFDPDLYYNPASILFKAKKPASGPKPVKRDYLVTDQDFTRIVKEITDRGINLTEDYDQWMVLGFSIATTFEEAGRDYFHRLSEISEKYDFEDCDKKYDNFLETKSGTLNLCWFYDHVKKEFNIKPYSEHTEAVLRAAQAVFEFSSGEGVEGIKEILRTKHAFTEDQIIDAETLISQAINRRIPVGGDSLMADVEAFLYSRFNIKKNTLVQQVEVDGKRLDQTKLNTMYVDAAKVYPKVNLQMIRALSNTDATPCYNPVTDLIDKYLANPPAQTKGYIDKMIATVITDTPNAAYFMKKWMVAMIPSAYGEHSPLMLIFCGVLNSGKTEWFRRYLPTVLKQYRADNALEEGKDSDILMSKKLLILDDEMGGKSKAEEKHLKNRTSKQEMSVRKPYDAEETEINRIAMLCGTSNTFDIINDPTGNRRQLCINVLDIDKEAYNQIDKELLLFECYLEWKAGYETKLTKADIQLLKSSSEQFQAANFTDEMFEKYFMHPDQSSSPITKMTKTDIIIYLNRMAGGAAKIDNTRLGTLLKSQGFEFKREGRGRFWHVVPTTEIENEIL